jgi:Protein of unknown function (DUF2490)
MTQTPKGRRAPIWYATILAGAASLAASPVAAQTLHDEQMWVNLTAMGSIKGRLVYFAEAQGRGGVGPRDFRQLLLRPAIGWRLSDKVTAYLGYARVETGTSDTLSTHEDRLFQQLNAPLFQIGSAAVTSRTRLEERWRNDGDEMGLRLRQMFRVAAPLATPPKGRPVRALAWSETFIGLNNTDWAAKSGFDQQRSFIGVEAPILDKSTIELGYLNQIVKRPSGGQRMNHILSITVFFRL